jgi:hypothetical protein
MLFAARIKARLLSELTVLKSGRKVVCLRRRAFKKGANMPCEIVEKEEGLITIKISGVLKRAELAQMERVAIEAMGPARKIKFLILTESFQGWDNKGNWEDVSFQSEYDEQIEKIAIVGEKRWQDLAEAFVGKGLRSMRFDISRPPKRPWPDFGSNNPVAEPGMSARLQVNRFQVADKNCILNLETCNL